jgi:hypothetical protein
MRASGKQERRVKLRPAKISDVAMTFWQRHAPAQLVTPHTSDIRPNLE